MDKYNDPKIIGPGVWFSIHLLCEKASRTKDVDDYAIAHNFIVMIINNFPVYDKKVEDFADTFTKFDSAKELSVWAYNFHAITQPEDPISHEELTSYFEALEDHDHDHDPDCDECDESSFRIQTLITKYMEGRKK